MKGWSLKNYTQFPNVFFLIVAFTFFGKLTFRFLILKLDKENMINLYNNCLSKPQVGALLKIIRSLSYFGPRSSKKLYLNNFNIIIKM